MGLIRKVTHVGTLGIVGASGQRETRARNAKAQAALARAEVGVARAQTKQIKAETKAVKRAPAAPVSTPAGWHRDPHGRHEMRYWDGSRWTEHVSTSGVTAIDLA